MKFLLYCDYGKSVGAGHLARVCSLGEELFIRNFAFNIIAPKEAQNSNLIENTISEYFITIEEAKKVNADFLIIDSYNPNVINLIEDLRIQVRQKFQVVDDISLPLNVDGYIPASPISNLSFKKFHKSQILCDDKDFVLLFRNRILDLGGSYKKVPDKIVITLGYYSDQNLLKKIVDSISTLKLPISIFIPDYFSGLGWPNNIFFYSPEKYLEEVCNCTLVISAAGVSILELMYINVPCMHIVVSDNQKYQSEYLVKNRLSTKLEIHADIEVVASQLKNYLIACIQPRSEMFLHDKLTRYELVDSLLAV
jgi:spore coat polysaccharide biosynthesis predicted glycosyltransferase SpsG